MLERYCEVIKSILVLSQVSYAFVAQMDQSSQEINKGKFLDLVEILWKWYGEVQTGWTNKK
jgi:hypothetical protein